MNIYPKSERKIEKKNHRAIIQKNRKKKFLGEVTIPAMLHIYTGGTPYMRIIIHLQIFLAIILYNNNKNFNL